MAHIKYSYRFWCLAILIILSINTPLYAEEYKAQRIISLGPTLTETLYLLGAEDRLVGVTTYCQKPPAAKNKEKVGTLTETNIEKILTLNPSFVLATSLTNKKALEKLKRLNIKIIQFPYATDFTEICTQFLKVGKILGKVQAAEKIVNDAALSVESIKKKNKGLPMQKVFAQIGSRPLFAATKDSFINSIIEFAGGKNITSGTEIGFYSREKVLEDNPDVIIIATMGIAAESEKQTWLKYKTLNAVKNNRIHIVDSYKFCSATPTSFVEALEEMDKILH